MEPAAFGWIVAEIVVSLGALSAGIGIFKAGIGASRFFAAASAAMTELVDVEGRQAAALEKSSSLVPLLERMSDEREQIGTTLRSVCREMRELKSWIQEGHREVAE